MSKLFHDDLVKLGYFQGYIPEDALDGICRGFSGMLMQAILAYDEDNFWRRLTLIEEKKEDLASLAKEINKVQSMKQENDAPNDRETALREISAFYAGVKLYLHPDKHSDVFNRDIRQKHLEEIYKLTKSQLLEKSDIVIAMNKLHAFTQESLKSYICDLGKAIGEYRNIPILLDNPYHSILLKYQPEVNINKPWMFVDTEDFERYPDNPCYYRELTSEEVAESIYVSLGESSGQILLNTTIVKTSANSLGEDGSLKELDAKYRIDSSVLNMYNHDKMGLLHFACQLGDLGVVKQILEKNDVNINQSDINDNTPLSLACQNGYLEIVEYLLQQQGIEFKISEVGSPLFLACRNGFYPIVELLLKQPIVQLYEPGVAGYTPFTIACYYGHHEIVRLLLEQTDIQINEPNLKDETPLEIACRKGHLEVVRLLLQQTDIDIDEENTPLHIACEHGHLKLVEFLLSEKDMPCDIQDLNGRTPFYLACENGHLDIVELLLKKDINYNSPNLNGYTPLHMACQNGHLATVELLLKQNINYNALTQGQYSPLHLACQHGHHKIVELLIQKTDLALNTQGKNHLTPISVACYKEHLEVVRLLVKHPSFTPNKDAIFALGLACMNGNMDIIKLLLDKKVPVNVPGLDGNTPLEIALAQKNMTIIKELMLQVQKPAQTESQLLKPHNTKTDEKHLKSTANDPNRLFARSEEKVNMEANNLPKHSFNAGENVAGVENTFTNN